MERRWDASYGDPKPSVRHDPFGSDQVPATSEVVVLDQLVAFLAGRGWMPTRLEFDIAGQTALWQAMSHYGSAGVWAVRLGIARRRPPRVVVKPSSTLTRPAIDSGRVRRLRAQLETAAQPAPSASSSEPVAEVKDSLYQGNQEQRSEPTSESLAQGPQAQAAGVVPRNKEHAAALAAHQAWNRARPAGPQPHQASSPADPLARPGASSSRTSFRANAPRSHPFRQT